MVKMPSVYDFHHIELDRIGRGKKRSVSIGCSEGSMKLVLKSSGSSPVSSASSLCSGSTGGSVGRVLTDRPQTKAGSARSLSSSPLSDGSLNSLNWTPTSSRPASRRGSRSEDTKHRLFGPPEERERRVKNLLQSKVFDTTDSVIWTKIAATKAPATYTPIRRNPITGEICDIQPKAVQNGLSKKPTIQSLPVTPTFNRQVPVKTNVISKAVKNLANDQSSISSSWLSINSSSSAPSN